MPAATTSRTGVALFCLALLVAGAASGAAAAEVNVAFEETAVVVEQGDIATVTVLFSGNVSEARLSVVGPDGENRTGVTLVDANDDGSVSVRVDTATTGEGFLTVPGDDTARFASFGGGDASPLAPGRYELSLSRDGEVRDVGVLTVEGETETTRSPTSTTDAPATTTAASPATETPTESTVRFPGFGVGVAVSALALAGLLARRFERVGRE